jgi:hypothetical protein
MKNLVRYRAMESLCRQAAVHHPLDSWRMLAEAEMWHHKALDEVASHFEEPNRVSPAAAPVPKLLPGVVDGARLGFG